MGFNSAFKGLIETQKHCVCVMCVCVCVCMCVGGAVYAKFLKVAGCGTYSYRWAVIS